MSQFLERFLNDVERSRPSYEDKLKLNVEIPQHILWMKAVLTEILTKKNKEKFYTISAPKEKFGFSEHLVNELMRYAYERGYESGLEAGKVMGREEFSKEVKKKLSEIVDDV
jgi:hypothetical protein